jgi:hypothetical protein
MAFINPGGTGVIAFAEYSDVTSADQRLFESNEGIADPDMVEDLTAKATNRILQLIKQSSWWVRYYQIEASPAQLQAAQTQSGYLDVPVPNPNLIRTRQSDFTDLCVYFTLYEYLLPKVADFSNEDTAEVRKIGFYQTKFDKLFRELIDDGSWYDFDDSGTVTSTEKLPTRTNLVRVR